MNREQNVELSMENIAGLVSAKMGCRTCGLMGWDSSLRK